MLTACVRDFAEQTAALETALSSGQSEATLQQTHPDYSDQIGDIKDLKRDLSWWTKVFDKRTVSFRNLKRDRSSSKGVLAKIVGEIELDLPGATRWKFTGPLELEFVDGAKPQIRSGILTDFRDIYGLMLQRRIAIEANESQSFGRLLHPKYQSGDENKREAVQRISDNIRGKAIRLDPQHYTIEVRESLAHVTEWLSVRVQAPSNTRLTPLSVSPQAAKNDKNELTLKKSAGRWRIYTFTARF